VRKTKRSRMRDLFVGASPGEIADVPERAMRLGPAGRIRETGAGGGW
jgi:hypothetical protein